MWYLIVLVFRHRLTIMSIQKVAVFVDYSLIHRHIKLKCSNQFQTLNDAYLELVVGQSMRKRSNEG